MKRIVFIFTIILFVSGLFVVENASAAPGKPGKHKSHKKAKSKKSGYFFNFQH